METKFNTGDTVCFMEAGEAIEGKALSSDNWNFSVSYRVEMPDGSARTKDQDELFATMPELVDNLAGKFTDKIKQDTGIDVDVVAA